MTNRQLIIVYKEKCKWYTSNPKIGDQIFLKNTTTGEICRSEMVYNVDSNYVYTIDYTNNRKKYLLNYSGIVGYGRNKE